MAETRNWNSSQGMRLEAPSPGDIVTVRIVRQPKRPPNALPEHPLALLLRMDGRDEADNPQHYRLNNIWRVLAVNGGQAVVEALNGSDKGRREIWSIAHHEWFEASELWKAFTAKESDG